MVKLIAHRSMRYAGKPLASGEVFEAKPRDAKILVAVRRAGRYVEPLVDSPVDPEPSVDPTPDLPCDPAHPAEPSAIESPAIHDEPPTDPPQEPIRRTYKRRDLKAES